MKRETAERIRALNEDYYHASALSVPDGWARLVVGFFGLLDEIGDLNPAVSVRFERVPSGLKAFCYPEMERWTDENMSRLLAAQRLLYLQSQRTCESCGGEVHDGPTGDRFLCTEHVKESNGVSDVD